MNFTLTPDQQRLRRRGAAPGGNRRSRRAPPRWIGARRIRGTTSRRCAMPGCWATPSRKAYGGAGGSFLDAAVIIEEMARVCGVTGRIAVETNMGAISAVMQYGSEAQKRLAARAGAGRRQAGDLHHRAGRRIRRHRHDHARRSAERLLRDQRAQALDHRRRRVEAAPDLRPRVRRSRTRTWHRRLPRGARRGEGPGDRQARADDGSARHSRDGDPTSRTWKCRTRWCCGHRTARCAGSPN